MYTDYEVVYESKLNEYAIFWIVFGIIALILFVLILFSMSRVLKKAGRSPLLGFIPIYNLIPSLEITNMEKKYFIPLIIPIVNIPFWLMLNLEIAKFFKKSKEFGIGLTVLPFIFYPILAFSGSEYIGINLVAMDNTNSTNTIPMIDDEKNTLIEKEVNDQMDTATTTSNISLGGGKYQKEYKNSLLSVEDNMIARGEVKKAKPKELITDGKFFNNNLLQKQQTSIEEEKTKTNDNIFNVSYINGNRPVQPTQMGIPNVNQNTQPVQQNPMGIPNINQNTKLVQQNTVSSNSNVDLLRSNAPTTGPKLCPNCGTRVADNAKICMICGQNL